MSLLPALGLVLTPAQTEKLAAALKQSAVEQDDKPTGRKRSASESDASGKRGAPTAPDLDKARFEQRWAKAGPRVESMRADLASKRYDAVADPSPLRKAIAAFGKADADLVKAGAEGRHAAAHAGLVAAEAAIADFDTALENDRKAYLKLEAEQQADTALMDNAVKAQSLGAPPADGCAEPVARFTRFRAVQAAAVADGNWSGALSALRSTIAARMLMKGSLNKTRSDLSAQLEASAKTAALAASSVGKAAKAAVAAHAGAKAALPRIDAQLEVAAAIAAMSALTQAMQAAREEIGQSLLDSTAGKGGAKESRKKAMAFLKQDPEALKWLQAAPGGKEALDAMVKDMGGAAKGAEDKEFMKSAIEARFGSKVTGDLTTKYLPRLYKALGMVPESHTKNNEKLTEIHRTRVKLMPSGDYDFKEKDKKGLINLSTPRTGSVDWLQSKVMAMGVKKIVGHLGGKDISTFDALTLHEVGHAVDEQKAFMKGKVGNVLYGGWQDHSVEEVAKFVGDGRGFFKDFGKLPRPFLEAYLKAVLENEKPEKTSGVTGAIGSNDKVDWKALAKHAATDTAEHIRMKGAGGLWDKGDGGASQYAIGGSVFQEAYEDRWVSYALSARGQKLTDYQFRSEAEWFAEPYAAFFLGKLKPNHPLFKMLQEDKDAAKSAQKAAK